MLRGVVLGFCSLKCSQDHARATMSNRVRGQCRYAALSSTARPATSSGGMATRAAGSARRNAKACGSPASNKRPRRDFEASKSPRSRVWFRKCKVCGRLFCGRSPSACYCSDECRYLVQLEVARQRGMGFTRQPLGTSMGSTAGRTTARGCYLPRRARRRPLCDLPPQSRYHAKVGHQGQSPRAVGRPHHPRSKGGSDDPVNLRLTHWGCNQSAATAGATNNWHWWVEMRTCAKCGASLPLQSGRGRRRSMCEECSPSRPRRKPAPRRSWRVQSQPRSVRCRGNPRRTRAGRNSGHADGSGGAGARHASTTRTSRWPRSPRPKQLAATLTPVAQPAAGRPTE